MAIFSRYVRDILPTIPTMFRRIDRNLVKLVWQVVCEAQDARAAALIEYIDTSWPLTTASGWVLDQHWGPMHAMQRNGLDDATYRLFIQAKRYLNRSWGSADQALEIFELLLPAATLQFLPWYPKTWEVVITGVDMADAAQAVEFMRKRPSPQGGGFSVAGDNAYVTIADKECLNFGSVYGVMGVDYQVTGWFGSVYGLGGGDQAGWAHISKI